MSFIAARALILKILEIVEILLQTINVARDRPAPYGAGGAIYLARDRPAPTGYQLDNSANRVKCQFASSNAS